MFRFPLRIAVAGVVAVPMLCLGASNVGLAATGRHGFPSGAGPSGASPPLTLRSGHSQVRSAKGMYCPNYAPYCDAPKRSSRYLKVRPQGLVTIQAPHFPGRYYAADISVTVDYGRPLHARKLRSRTWQVKLPRRIRYPHVGLAITVTLDRALFADYNIGLDIAK